MRIVSGVRPTGRLHLGHLWGALRNWTRLQSQHECFFFIADWHALTDGYEKTAGLTQHGLDMLVDWLAAGLDPARAVMFRQSSVKEHAELHLLLSMMVPTPWLLRNPTIKDHARELGLIDGDDETALTQINYGLLGYPVLQAADVIVYKARGVPVGIDQVPHIELTREIVRRFNRLYGDVFPEPDALLTEVPKIPGTDGRKMGKSYNNAVFLGDTPKEIDAKLSRMVTDPRRQRRTDPGDPKDCPAFNLHRVYCTPDEIEHVSQGCRSASIGCLDCKKIMIKHVVADLEPISERRAELEKRPDDVRAILADGNRRAQTVAAETMDEVRRVMHLQD